MFCLAAITASDHRVKTQSQIEIGSGKSSGKEMVTQVLCLADFEGDVAFLESEQGSAFLPVFAHLRLPYIVSDLASARIVERDSLIPPGE